MSDSDSFGDPFSSWLATLRPESVERERCTTDVGMLIATESVSLGLKYVRPRGVVATREQWERADADRFILDQSRKQGDPFGRWRAQRKLRLFERQMRDAGYRVTREAAA